MGELFLQEGSCGTVTIEEIAAVRGKVREMQNFRRFEHTLGVAHTAACLAFLNGVDPLRAELAGYLHDCAKCFPDSELVRLCGEAGIPLSEEELASPQVIHAVYGPYLAEHELGITDPEILSAIRYHTTGRPGMSVLEMIIFIADFIEPLRNQAPNLKEARALAFTDPEECVYNILAATVSYLGGRNALIVPDTLAAYEWYKKKKGH